MRMLSLLGRLRKRKTSSHHDLRAQRQRISQYGVWKSNQSRSQSTAPRNFLVLQKVPISVALSLSRAVVCGLGGMYA